MRVAWILRRPRFTQHYSYEKMLKRKEQPMAKLNGVHHIAIMTADVKTQIEFFSDVLGMKIAALYWMHNVEGYFHAFMELNPSCSVAF